MNKEKIPVSFPGQNKIEGEAHKINGVVNEFNKRPRTKKSRPANDVAHEIIKKEKSAPIDPAKIPKEERPWNENMRNAGIHILSDGFMEIPRWDKTGKNTSSPLRIRQKVDGINSAIRMQDNILENYRAEEKSPLSEFSKIESIQEVIEYANELLISWRNAKPEDKKDLQMQLADVVLQLENCRKEFKVAAKDQADAIMKLKDSLGRENPGALAARTVAALNNLAKRIDEMQLVMPIMALRKEVLILEKRRCVGALNRSAAYLTGISRPSVFHDHPIKPPASRINDNEVVELDKKIGKALHLLDTIHALPYSQQAEQAKFQLINKAKRLFMSKKKFVDNLGPAKEALEETIKILKSDIEHLG